MHQEVKENANCMLKRFKTLLGKKEAECEMTNKELTKKINDLMSELEARTGQVRLLSVWSIFFLELNIIRSIYEPLEVAKEHAASSVYTQKYKSDT